MRLWLRIFLACAGLVILTLVGYVAWQQRTFSAGFADYLDSIALERARQAAPRLAEAYRNTGNWDFLRNDPMLLGMMLDERGPGSRPPRRPPTSNTSERIPWAGSPAAPQNLPRDRPPMPAGDWLPPSTHMPPGGPPPTGASQPAGPSPFALALDFGRRLRLVDSDGDFIAGARGPASGLPGVPVQVDDQVVATIEITPLPAHVRESPEGEFASTQLRMAGTAALVMLLVALLLAWALARWLLRPVRDLAEGTHALAVGDYTRRVPVRGGDELATLARDFNRMAEGLEQHQRDRRRWGQDIAHELRTPLTILRAELQTLIDGVRTTTPEALSSLLAECERLSRLVDELRELAIADDSTQYLAFAPVDLIELAQSALDVQRGSLAAAGLVAEIEPPERPMFVLGDENRLAQLLDNLLLNAARYTDAPGRIRLSLRIDGEHGVLVIADSAPGVSDADLPHLFERLYRADPSRSRRTGGSGLGLAICRAIVEAHHGSIQAGHATLGGLEIVVRLPLAQAPT